MQLRLLEFKKRYEIKQLSSVIDYSQQPTMQAIDLVGFKFCIPHRVSSGSFPNVTLWGHESARTMEQ
jgi:hypothetical protein